MQSLVTIYWVVPEEKIWKNFMDDDDGHIHYLVMAIAHKAMWAKNILTDF